MNMKKLLARVVRWRYWKQLQRSERRRTANPDGFIFLKFSDYEYKHPFQRNRNSFSRFLEQNC